MSAGAERIVQGHIDKASGQPCAWANGGIKCGVPQCRFAADRCILVQRQRGEVSA